MEEGEKTEAGEGEAENEKEQTDDQDPEEVNGLSVSAAF